MKPISLSGAAGTGNDPCVVEPDDKPWFSTCEKAELVELIRVTDYFGLGTAECPRRPVYKYFSPEDGRLLAVYDTNEGEPDYRLYPPVKQAGASGDA